jgi:spore coat protein U-like protein
MTSLQRLLILFGLALAIPAWSATTTTTMGVSGTVVPACTISSAPLSFGTTIANPIAANLDANSTVSATCSTGTPYTVALDAGTGAGATILARRMTGPAAATMNYSLYTTAARGVVWGDGTAGTVTVPGTGNGAAQTLTVFGRITPQTVAATGAFTDTITVTLTF